MDDENLMQESFFTAFRTVIIGLSSDSPDFDFQIANLRQAVLITQYLTSTERFDLIGMLNAKALLRND